jgi:hypothetical protein
MLLGTFQVQTLRATQQQQHTLLTTQQQRVITPPTGHPRLLSKVIYQHAGSSQAG